MFITAFFFISYINYNYSFIIICVILYNQFSLTGPHLFSHLQILEKKIPTSIQMLGEWNCLIYIKCLEQWLDLRCTDSLTAYFQCSTSYLNVLNISQTKICFILPRINLRSSIRWDIAQMGTQLTVVKSEDDLGRL